MFFISAVVFGVVMPVLAHASTTLTVNKLCSQPGDPGKFNLKIDGVTAGTDVPCGGTTGGVTVSAGLHTVSETAGTGTNLANYSEVIGPACAANGQVTVLAGQNITCTIINNNLSPTGTLTVKKHVINDNGGTTTASGFTLHVKTSPGGIEVSGSPAAGSESGVVYTLAPGNYTITESANTGYLQTYSGDCDSTGTVSIFGGNVKSCTLTNDDIQPKLTVTKIVVNHGLNLQPSNFPLFVGSTSVVSGAQNGFNAGSYVVSETSDSRYDLTFDNSTCPSGNITLNVGDVKTCTLFNSEKLSSLTVHKVVINHTGNANINSFAPYQIDGNTVNLDQQMTINSGAHVVTETANSNFPTYSATFSGGCDASGNVTLISGDNKTCTITNQDPALPYINNLGVTDTTCIGIPGSALVYFSWNYNSDSGQTENKFQFQMATANDPNFTAATFTCTDSNDCQTKCQSDSTHCAVSRYFDTLTNPSGTVNQQSVLVNIPAVSDAIIFNTPYYWRARVVDALGNVSPWVKFASSYTKAGHPDPVPSFTFSPVIPLVGQSIAFTGSASCYNSNGPTACASYSWDFGDTGTSSIQNPNHTYTSQGTFTAALKAFDDTRSCSIGHIISVNTTAAYILPVWKETPP